MNSDIIYLYGQGSCLTCNTSLHPYYQLSNTSTEGKPLLLKAVDFTNESSISLSIIAKVAIPDLSIKQETAIFSSDLSYNTDYLPYGCFGNLSTKSDPKGNILFQTMIPPYTTIRHEFQPQYQLTSNDAISFSFYIDDENSLKDGLCICSCIWSEQ